MNVSSPNALVRPRNGRVLAGVCRGVANRFGWDVTIVRLLTVLSVVFLGLPIWLYLLLWVIMPGE